LRLGVFALKPFAGSVAAPKVASRRRAEAALWRAAKAEGLAQSKTLRGCRVPPQLAPAFGSAAALRRFPTNRTRTSVRGTAQKVEKINV